MVKRWKFLTLFGVTLMAAGLIACAPVSTTTASCAYVVGNGSSGTDSEVHSVVYPGQKLTYASDKEYIRYVPCNSRNYIINDGTIRNANKDLVGDRFTQIEAVTDTETAILISASAFWTLNQTEKAMRDFYTVCHKYTCWSDKDVGGNINSATGGWNNMLGENFGFAMDKAAQIAARQAKDSIWKSKDPVESQKLADGMSKEFGDAVRARLGFSEDLFCGSGNSSWKDPRNPGKDGFTCSPVRMVVDFVQLKPANADQSSQSLKAINDLRYSNAQALYGPEAGFWLGLQDSIEKCKGAATPCMFNVGGSGGGPALPVPAIRSNPTPAPTPVRS